MITLITGGSGSGKSAYAENRILASGCSPRIYLATMEPFGEEGARRIARHLKLREGKGFDTVERYTDLSGLMIPRGSSILLECMSNLVANEMFRPDGAKEHLLERILSGVGHLEALSSFFCIVTNDIFSESMEYQGETVQYQKYLAEVNAELAKMADEVLEVVCGIPMFWKGSN